MPLNNLTFHHFGVRRCDLVLCLVVWRAMGSTSSAVGRGREPLERKEGRRFSHGFFCECIDDRLRVSVGACDGLFVRASAIMIKYLELTSRRFTVQAMRALSRTRSVQACHDTCAVIEQQDGEAIYANFGSQHEFSGRARDSSPQLLMLLRAH